MRRSRTTVTWAVAIVWMGCGGGGGGAGDTGSPDQGVADSGPQDAVWNEWWTDPGATDFGTDSIEGDLVIPDVPPQDPPSSETAVPDALKPDVPSQDPGEDFPTPAKFIVRVVEEGQVPGQPDPVPGATVAILDNATGGPTGMSGQTDANGEVAFDLEAGLVFGVSVKKDTYVDRYFPNVRREWDRLEVGMLPLAMVDGVAQMIGAPWDHATGMVTGHVMFPKGDGNEEVGCAVIESDRGGEVRYWDPAEDMPTTLDKAPNTSKENSNFVVIGIPPGPVRLTVRIEGDAVATKDTISFAGGMTSIEVPVPGDANPTPADCPY